MEYEGDQQALLENIPTTITKEENEAFVGEISDEEIINSIWSLGQDKAPWPNGFCINFFKVLWEVIKYDLKRMLNYTLTKKKIGGARNSTF